MYIHAYRRKPIPTENQEGLDATLQTARIVEYLKDNLGITFEDKKWNPKITSPSDIKISWKVDARESSNTRFLEKERGKKLFRPGYVNERNLRFGEGDMLIVSQYNVIFGDHPQHVMDVIFQTILRNKKGRFVIVEDFGEVTSRNNVGKSLKNVLSACAGVRREKTKEYILKSKRSERRKKHYLGGKTPFGKRINLEGILVPDNTELKALKRMKQLRKEKTLGKIMPYRKITEIINKELKMNMTCAGVWRVLKLFEKVKMK